MRNAFINTLEKEVKKNKNILLLTADLGFTVFEKFIEKFPDNFFNMGVAEANMVGVSSGLALTGKIPFIYSIAPFVTLRPYEQIRNDICLHNANVKIVGVGSGFSYTHAGPTHHILEDIAVMRALPNMTIICPADPIETELAVKEAIRYRGPVYLRLAKKGEPKIYEKKPDFRIGKGIVLKKGKDIALISSGSIIYQVIQASKLLLKKGISVSIIDMHTIKPLDIQLLQKLINENKAIFTIEEHSIIGGLGSAVSEYLSEQNKKLLFKRIGINDIFCKKIGDYDHFRDFYNLSSEKITQLIISALKHEN